MQRLIYIGVSVFICGFVLKFFHIHYHTLIMLLGLLLLFVFYTIVAFKKQYLRFFIGLAMLSWLIHLFVTVKYLPFDNITLIIAICLSSIVVYQSLKKKKASQLIVVALSAALSMIFYWMPTDMRYHLFSIRWNHEIASDYQSWDKYSWFLYQNGKYKHSLDASDRATEIVESSGNDQWKKRINDHKQMIKARNWQRYQD